MTCLRKAPEGRLPTRGTGLSQASRRRYLRRGPSGTPGGGTEPSSPGLSLPRRGAEPRVSLLPGNVALTRPMHFKIWALIVSVAAVIGFWAGAVAPGRALLAEGYPGYGFWRLCAEQLRPAVTPAVLTALGVGLALALAAHALAAIRRRRAGEGAGDGRPQPAAGAGLGRAWTLPILAAGVVHLLLATGIELGPALDQRFGRRGPDVLLIVIDTLRADHLGAFGYRRDTSPHLDALAEDSISWRRALSQAPWTSPAVGSLLTALQPAALGYGDSRNPARPDDRVLYLAEILRENGYATQAIVSHSYLSARLGFDQGFERFDEGDARGPGHISSPSVTDKAIAALERPKRRPFYLLAHYFDPHFNYLRHPPFDFDPGYDGELPEHMGELRRIARDLGPRDLEQLRARYDSEIRFTDQHIGRLLAALRALGRYEQTLIVVTADHGEAFLDRDDGWIGHTKTLFQEAIHVPLLVKLPGGAGAGTVVDVPVGLVDLVPSLLGYLELRRPRGYAFDGRALPLADPAALRADGRPVFSETTARGRWLQSVVRGRFKLIFDRRRKRMSFFDLSRDPAERQNLVAERPAALRELARELRAWNQRMSSRRPQGNQPLALSAKDKERLRALGYL